MIKTPTNDSFLSIFTFCSSRQNGRAPPLKMADVHPPSVRSHPMKPHRNHSNLPTLNPSHYTQIDALIPSSGGRILHHSRNIKNSSFHFQDCQRLAASASPDKATKIQKTKKKRKRKTNIKESSQSWAVAVSSVGGAGEVTPSNGVIFPSQSES